MTPNLASTTFSNIVEALPEQPPKALVAIPPTTPIDETFTLLAKTNVLTFPIKSHDSSKIVAIVNVADLLAHVLLSNNAQDALKEPVENVLGLEDEKESYRIFEKDVRDTISDTVSQFNKGLHRVLITDVLQKRPTILLTQSDILSFICSNATSLLPETLLSSPVSSLFPPKSVFTLSSSCTARQGYEIMIKHGVSGLPIVDDASGIVVGSLSVSDLRGLMKQGFNLAALDKPVLEFTKTFSKFGPQDLSVVSLNTSFKDTMQLFCKKRFHRVWVTDSVTGKVVGAVSLSDLMGAFSKI